MIGHSFKLTAAVLLALGGAAAAQSDSVKPQESARYIVVFQKQVDDSRATSIVALADQARVERTWKHALNGVVLSGIDAEDAKRLSQEPGVISVEPVRNFVLEPLARPGSKEAESANQLSAAPQLNAVQLNPPNGLDRIDQRSLPLDQSYTYNYQGTGVLAFIVDSGMRATHEDFRKASLPLVSRAANAYNALPDADVDTAGHGTHVAGIVGGLTSGVAKDITLRSVRVCNQPPGFQGILFPSNCPSDAVLDGLDYIAGAIQVGAEAPTVVNMSLAQYDSAAISSAISTLNGLGAFFTSSAGNSAANVCSQPATNTVHASGNHVVASVGSDMLAPSSNYGPCIFIGAPGSVIRSASIASDTAYYNLTGTSQAAPHVTGAAALVWEQYPAYSQTQVGNELLTRATTGLPNFWNSSPDSGHLTPNRLLYTLP